MTAEKQTLTGQMVSLLFNVDDRPGFWKEIEVLMCLITEPLSSFIFHQLTLNKLLPKEEGSFWIFLIHFSHTLLCVIKLCPALMDGTTKRVTMCVHFLSLCSDVCDRIRPVFNAVKCEGPKITCVIYELLALSFVYKDFSRLFNSEHYL